MGLTLGINLEFHTSIAKELKLSVEKIWGPIPMFTGVTREELVGRAFLPTPKLILNRIKVGN